MRLTKTEVLEEFKSRESELLELARGVDNIVSRGIYIAFGVHDKSVGAYYSVVDDRFTMLSWHNEVEGSDELDPFGYPITEEVGINLH